MEVAEHDDALARDGRIAPAHTPRLRTLLLTDLVDSTALIEALGDGPAGELFRAHDRLVLQLQQRWNGRLIDRSDGMLLLFERPIDGLGFALDYARGLLQLGDGRNLMLRARAGLHVGEVLTWRNSDEAVSVGAKPLEVEGLAKPLAARLMSMARPGQILLSAIAEPLARRAASELGERGRQLLWKSHGRWRLKGVPEAQEIFEVGEPGVAPFRSPASTAKARRQVPLWRRPASLVAEAALLAGMAAGAWLLGQPSPAIAFDQRDWVVVGDLRNITGQVVLDDSLQQAFRISLEQSRHVNVLSDLKARDTLVRMRRPADTVLDRATASEVALRDGARAVILPTVAEVGGRVRVSAEVIDPHTQTTVYAESAEGRGIGSTLESIDQVTAALRRRLGEAVKSIERDSAPLPRVTTPHLDALRAYALAEDAYARRRFDEALQLYERATHLDPKFALAWIGQTRVRVSSVNASAAIAPLRRAQGLRAHLAPREALYLDAWAASFDAPARAPGQWRELAKLYPDYLAGVSNAAMWTFSENRFEEALALATAATVPQNARAGIEFDTVGRARLALEQHDAAARALDRSMALGYGSSLRRRLMVEAARRDFAAADRFAARLPRDDRHAYLEWTSLAIDRAGWSQAQERARTALSLVRGPEEADARLLRLPVAVADWAAGDAASALAGARETARAAVAALSADFDPDAEDDAVLALGAALLAQRLGDRRTPTLVLAAIDRKPGLKAIAAVGEFAAVLQARTLRLDGEPKRAAALLQPYLNGRERFQTRVEMMEALAAVGDLDGALAQARWLQSHRGRAYAEHECGWCLQALNVADSNLATLREGELLAAGHRQPEAARALARFDGYWPTADLPVHLGIRRSRARGASN